MSEAKIEVEQLEKHFPVEQGLLSSIFDNRSYLNAVDGVSFSIEEGEAFGFAGESGCGKTTTVKTALRILEPTDGHVYIDGEDITDYSKKELRELRRQAQMIPQDPFESINPRFKVFNWVIEPLEVHGIGSVDERRSKVYQVLEEVGLNPPEDFVDQYPGNLSGGERQRVSIARSLVLQPEILVADEPASMLDVSIRASILRLLRDLQHNRGLTALYISHDLSLLRYLCDRIAIMYLGNIVEVGPTDEIIDNPKHPYTQALVSAIPAIDPDITQEPVQIPSGVPDPIDVPDECRFYHRCPERMDACTRREPPMYETDTNHHTRCVLYAEENEVPEGSG